MVCGGGGGGGGRQKKFLAKDMEGYGQAGRHNPSFSERSFEIRKILRFFHHHCRGGFFAQVFLFCEICQLEKAAVTHPLFF